MTKKKILTILGNRPQFIKSALISEGLKDCAIEEILVHTGQHYDTEMSDIFFKELKLKTPDYNLRMSSFSEIEFIAKTMISLEIILKKEAPDLVLVYGDTNSTLAGALSAKKLKFPLAHIEAGPRSHDLNLPEEMHRVTIDHISDLLFAPDQASYTNLFQEGISKEKIFFSGDILLDLFLCYSKKLVCSKKDYVFVTLHRQYNVDQKQSLLNFIELFENSSETFFLNLHPRTLQRLKTFELLDKIKKIPTIILLNPTSYLQTLKLILESKGVLTDSGGLQKEAFFAQKPCYVALSTTLWPDIEHQGWQKVIGNANTLKTLTLNFAKDFSSFSSTNLESFGNGHAKEKILQTLKAFLKLS